MTDSEIKRKMEQICKLSQDLDEEAKRRYGKEAQLFLETNSLHFSTHIPDGVRGTTMLDRQAGILFTARAKCCIESGAW